MNLASTQSIGSAEIFVPTGFSVTSASISPPVAGSAVSFDSSSALFLNLSLAPGGSLTFNLGVIAPCTSASPQWSIYLKQSNQFNGPPGNDFSPYPYTSSTPAITGTCSLKFKTQPTSTLVGVAIPSMFNTSALTNPIDVEVLDGIGNPSATPKAAITVSLASDPGGLGTLSGTTTESASGGIASFSDLAINQPAPGYELGATSPGITSATSTAFTIYSSLPSCTSSGCNVPPNGTKTTTLSVSSTVTSGFLGAGVGGQNFQCNGSYVAVSDPGTFDVLNSDGSPNQNGTETVQLEISKTLVQSSGHNGASTWQICYLSSGGSTFNVQTGTATTVTVGTVTYSGGLLLDCSAAQPAPCVLARNKDNAGDVVITFLGVGDPVGRG